MYVTLLFEGCVHKPVACPVYEKFTGKQRAYHGKSKKSHKNNVTFFNNYIVSPLDNKKTL
jgi:hypothetical protein